VTDNPSNRLRLWQVEVETNRADASPAKPRYYSRKRMVNVAAPDIVSAIDGALGELAERDEFFDRDSAWVISANHRGAVNRIVTDA